MNGLLAEGIALTDAILRRLTPQSPAPEILLCPPATLLHSLAPRLAASPLRLGAQDCRAENAGAYTGDLSAPMLRDAGAVSVILGHSERRSLHQETDALIRAKARAALAAGLQVILCVGESEQERLSGDALAVVGAQLAASLPEAATPETLVLAYEPVWAIGTGRIPSLGDIDAMHAHLREILVKNLPQGGQCRILYGGSVKPSNAAEVLAGPDVDGALVGGASLKAEEFCAIIEAVPEKTRAVA